MIEPEVYKETRHVFNVVFNNSENVLGNQYRFNCEAIYWTTEVISGKSALVGAIVITACPTIFVGGSGTSRVYTTGCAILNYDISVKNPIFPIYTETSSSAIVNPYDLAALA